MSDRRSFLKMLSMAAIASALPMPKLEPERLTIKSTGYEGIGIERMRITSSGNVCLGTTVPEGKLKLTV